MQLSPYHKQQLEELYSTNDSTYFILPSLIKWIFTIEPAKHNDAVNFLLTYKDSIDNIVKNLFNLDIHTEKNFEQLFIVDVNTLWEKITHSDINKHQPNNPIHTTHLSTPDSEEESTLDQKLKSVAEEEKFVMEALKENELKELVLKDYKYWKYWHPVLTPISEQELTDTTYEYVNHPTHYNKYDVEVIDMMEKIWGTEQTAIWCKLTAFKYRMRIGLKPDNSIQQDIDKESWYLDKYNKLMDKKNNTNP